MLYLYFILLEILNHLLTINNDLFECFYIGYECTLYQMKLEREAEYISRVVELFYMPRDMNDISLVTRISSILLTIRVCTFFT